jgi:hypothetical protein
LERALDYSHRLKYSHTYVSAIYEIAPEMDEIVCAIEVALAALEQAECSYFGEFFLKLIGGDGNFGLGKVVDRKAFFD